MKPVLKVLSPGLSTTVQDMGRIGFLDVGLPHSGPLDAIALRLANALVGNAGDAPALEILLHGPTLEVVGDAVRVAVVGGGPTDVSGRSEERIAGGRSMRLAAGDVLRIGALREAACAYLAIEGGFDVPPVLGSASTYMRGALGGVEGRALRQGDILYGAPDAEARPECELAAPLDASFDQHIRVVMGPQDDFFTPEAIERFLSSPYRVSQQADRMGFRLDGPVLDHARGYNIVSDGIVPGSIQAPGSGLPIILLADHQTTGGYPKIATVISADVPLVGRRKAGSEIRFRAVSRDEAEAIRRRQEEDVRRMIADIGEVTDEPSIDLDKLYSANLIDGLVSAFD